MFDDKIYKQLSFFIYLVVAHSTSVKNGGTCIQPILSENRWVEYCRPGDDCGDRYVYSAQNHHMKNGISLLSEGHPILIMRFQNMFLFLQMNGLNGKIMFHTP